MANINTLLEQNKLIAKAKEKELRFAVIGLTGAGKSSTINALFGEDVAEVNRYTSTTHSVIRYANESLGIKYSIFDTPGLGESEDEKQNIEYVTLIKEKIKELDCVLYVTHLEDPRVRADEQRCIRLFSSAFGASVWKHAVIVFTSKYPVSENEFNDLVLNRTNLIRNEIYKHTKNEVVGEVPATSISITSNLTPDNKEWLPQLFIKIVNQISNVGGLSFVLANANRIDNGNISLTEKEKENIAKKFSLSQETIDRVKGYGAMTGVTTVAGFLVSTGTPIGLAAGIVVGVVGSIAVSLTGWLGEGDSEYGGG